MESPKGKTRARKIVEIIFISLIAITAFSCEDKYSDNPCENAGSTSAMSETRYFPLSVGAYWIYRGTKIDSLGREIPESEEIDSAVVESSVFIAGKSAKEIVVYQISNAPKIKYKRYYHSENGAVWSLSSYLDIFSEGIPFSLIPVDDSLWIKIYDENDDLFRLYRIYLDNNNLPGLPLKVDKGKAEIIKSYEKDINLDLMGRSFATQEWLSPFEFYAMGRAPFIGDYSINAVRDVREYYAKDVGVVKTVVGKLELSLPVAGGVSAQEEKFELIRYKIIN